MPQDIQSTIKDPEFLKLSPDDQVAVLKHLQSLDPQRGAQEATGVRARTTKDVLKSAALTGASYLPTVGGGVGGAIATATSGPEAAPVGAGLGGAAGKLGQQAVERSIYGKNAPPLPPGEQAKQVGQTALEQAALEAGGQVLGRGAEVLAKSPAAERFAARPISRMLRAPQEAFTYATERDFPGTVLARQPGLPIATGRYGMRNFIRQRIDTLTGQLESTATRLSQQGRRVNLEQPVSDAIAESSRVPQEYEQKALVRKLADAERRLTTKEIPNSFTTSPTGQLIPMRQSRGLRNATLDDALQYRRDLDDMIGKFKKDTDEPLKQALQKVRARVNRAIHDAAPEIKDTDTQIHHLISSESAMSERIRHLESGTREQSAGRGVAERAFSKLPTRTVPWESASSKVRRAVTQVGGTPARRAVIKQVPRAFGALPPPPEPDEDEE